MVTLNFIASKSEAWFVVPTVAVEKKLDKTVVRFAFLRAIFSVELIKPYYCK